MDVKVKEPEKKVKMCRALQEMTDEAREAGISEGKIEGKIEGEISTYREFGVSEEEIVKKLIAKHNMDEDKARKYCKEVQ